MFSCGLNSPASVAPLSAPVTQRSTNRAGNSTNRLELELRFTPGKRNIREVVAPQNLWIDRIPLFWRLNVAGWMAFLLPEFLLGYGAQRNAERAITLTFVQLPIQLAITWLLQSTYRRLGTTRAFGVPNASWMIFLCLILANLQVALVHIVTAQLGYQNPHWTPLEEWLIRAVFAWLVYIGWSLFYFWLKTDRAAQKEARRAEKAQFEAERMELHLLRAQLDPHFLFNGLNGIAAEISPHPDHALEMVRELAGYLRYSLEHRHTEVTPLAAELDALKGYLRIEQARFGEGLRPSVEATPEARRRCIPSFLLQPMVENAVKHSRPDKSRIRRIALTATVQDETLFIEVGNTGEITSDWNSSSGIGLQTLRRRLELHYPERHRFTLTQANDMVLAKLELIGDPCSR